MEKIRANLLRQVEQAARIYVMCALNHYPNTHALDVKLNHVLLIA